MTKHRTYRVVFDIDDTLYLERDYVISGFRSVAEVGVIRKTSFFETALSLFEEGHRGNIFDLALRGCGIEPDQHLVTQLVRIYRSHTPRISLLPDALRCLTRHRANCGIVSDGPLESQRMKVSALGLRMWADPIILTAEHGPAFHKPSTRAFELAVPNEQDLEANVYVADNPAKDFEGPKRLGWGTVRVRRLGGLHCAVDSKADVDREIESLDDLEGALATL